MRSYEESALMDKYFAKIKEYLAMDTEISYEEFAGFYTDFMESLIKISRI
jgi:hypothetical protein